MIFLHLLLGLLLGKFFGHTSLFTFASIIPDIDHIYVILKHRLFTKKKLLNALAHEERYRVRFKTPLMHSLLGLVLCSAFFFLFVKDASLLLIFLLMYLSHLLLDWPDIDKKQYLYPCSKKEFSGFLPIWSSIEKRITLIASLLLLFLYFLF